MHQYSITPIKSSEIATPNGTHFMPAPSLIQLNAWVDDEVAWYLSKAAICCSSWLFTASSSTQAIWIGLKISRRRQISEQACESC